MEAVEVLQLDRVDHGYHVVDDPAVLQRARAAGVHFCATPKSAHLLSGWAFDADHPVARMIEAGLSVNLSTDDEVFFDTSLQAEFEHVGIDLGFGADVVQRIALDGVEAKLETGAKVADIGCGHGASTVIMAEAFPNSRFTGFDYHDGSVEQARQRAESAGVGDRVSFETAAAADYPGEGYDLVTVFDCLHDMGDPVGAARHVRDTLSPDGTWMVVEPQAGDRVEDNLNPVGRVYYGFSTFLCVPNALSQDGGYALGAQAGEAAIRRIVSDAGFTRFRRAAETPFNNVYEARP